MCKNVLQSEEQELNNRKIKLPLNSSENIISEMGPRCHYNIIQYNMILYREIP